MLESIWNYHTTAEIIAAGCEQARQLDSGLTLNGWARQLGERNCGNLVHYLKGTRCPTLGFIDRLSSALGLDEREAEYLRLLAQAERHRKKPSGQLFAEQARRLRFEQRARTIDLARYAFIASPLHHAIRETLFLRGAERSLEWLRRQLPVETSPDELTAALEDLVRSGLLSRTPDGWYAKSARFWETPSETPSEALRLFHERSLREFGRALAEVPATERMASGCVFSMPKSALPQAKQTIEEFISSFIERFSPPSDQCDRIQQIQIVLIPWSEST